MPPGERELLLLRHAKSSSKEGRLPDFDRPLAPRGRRDAPRVGRWLATEGLVPDWVVSSPARRARETTELVLGELGIDPAQARFDRRVYEADVGTLLRVLADLPAERRRVLLVGHNPGLEGLLCHLAGADVELPADGKLLPAGAVARLRATAPWDRIAAGGATLVTILRPRTLEGGGRG